MWKALRLQPSQTKHGESLATIIVGLAIFLVPSLYTHAMMWNRLGEVDVYQLKRAVADFHGEYRGLREEHFKPQPEGIEATTETFAELPPSIHRVFIPFEALDDEGEEAIHAALADYEAWQRSVVKDNKSNIDAALAGQEASFQFNYESGDNKIEQLETVVDATVSRPVIWRPELCLELYYVGSPILFLGLLLRALLARPSALSGQKPMQPPVQEPTHTPEPAYTEQV